MKTATSLEIFINRFAFNKDAEIQYLYHGLTSGKPYIEQLKVSILKLNKSQKIHKKNLTTIKVKTDKNAKKFFESYENVENDFFRMVDLLKDTHNFFVNIFKIDIFTKQNMSYEDMYKNFSDITPNFTELMQQIEFTKEERFILNTFNRMRNIIIHAPSGIIIGYLTENVLEEFRSCVNLAIGIANDILYRIKSSVNAIIDLQQEDIVKDDNTGVEYAKDFAVRYNLSMTELLDMLRNSGHDFVVEIHPDMQLDAYSKDAIMPIIEEKIKQKNKHDNEVKLHNYVSNLHKSESFMIVDFDYVLGLFDNNINKTYNHIYELYENCKANKVSLISESKSKEILQAIDELHFTTNNKQKIAKDCKELLEYISSSNNFDIIIAYVDNKIKNCLDNYECNKYLINHNKDCSLSNDISDWNSIVLEKNKIVDIQLKTN